MASHCVTARSEKSSPPTSWFWSNLGIESKQDLERSFERFSRGVPSAVEDDSIRAERAEVVEILSGLRSVEPMVGIEVIQPPGECAAAVTLCACTGKKVFPDHCAVIGAGLIAAIDGGAEMIGAGATRRRALEDEPKDGVHVRLQTAWHQDDLVARGAACPVAAARLERVHQQRGAWLEHIE